MLNLTKHTSESSHFIPHWRLQRLTMAMITFTRQLEWALGFSDCD